MAFDVQTRDNKELLESYAIFWLFKAKLMNNIFYEWNIDKN
jgi:hypothetical protein